MMDDHLLEAIRERRPAALSLLTASFGRDATGVAFLILQHRGDAAEAAARGFADLWRSLGERPPDPDNLRGELLGRTAAQALRLRARSTTVDPALTPVADQQVRELEPMSRAVVALAVIGGLEDARMAELLGVPAGRVSSLLAPMTRDGDGLASAVRRSLHGLPVVVDAEMVARALQRSPDPPARRRWILPLAAAAILVASLAAVNWPGDHPAAVATSPAAGTSSRPAVSQAPIVTVRPEQATALTLTPPGAVNPYTLGACGLPDDLPIDYAGWVDPLALDPAWNGLSDEVYALVTADASGPITCLWGRTLGGYARVRPAADWAPPVNADGCARSPVGEYGGYREVGGPGAFVVPSVTPGGWQAGDGTTVRMLVRIAPPPAAQGPIGASLRSPTSGALVTARVGTKPVDPLAPGSTAADRHARYVWLDGVTVPTAGCWILNVTVGDSVVGAATVTFSAGG